MEAETEASLAGKIELAETMMRTAWARGFTRAQAHIELLLARYRAQLERVRGAQ